MAIPGSRGNKGGDGRGYPRPRPAYKDNNSDRPRPSYGIRRDENAGDNFSPSHPVSRLPELPVIPPPAPTEPATPHFVLTDDLRELIKLVAASDLSEVSLETPDWKVQIKREKQAVVEYAQVAPPPIQLTSGRTGHTASPVVAAPVAEDNYHKVTSPMVGIFYRSPDPKARPFVQEGEMVEKGQTIGIIEAMKIMNEIVSEHSGRCVRVNAENGQPVEYGQTLLLLEPA